MFEDKRILITGGTGSLGRALTKRLLKYDVESIRILSRNENNQIKMEHEYDDSRLRFFIGDIRDKERLMRAMEGVNIVFHAAALKHVPIIEYNPFEAVKTNVIGTQNVIDACHTNKVEIAVGVGTDKAVSPLNTYGATKLLMERLFVSASNYVDVKKHPTKFITVRYGNVLGSSGSVLPKFYEQIISKGKITITDTRMTRFSILMDEALDFILNSAKIGKGSDTFVPKLKAYNILDFKDALFSIVGKAKVEITKIRPGEKINEVLINLDEMRNTLENKDNYVIIKPTLDEKSIRKAYPDYKPVKTQFIYSSDNAEKITKDELIKLIKKTGLPS
ncbi:MAG: SDR family NAD(P)-dependent oxidoreductase [Thaumarchaeota archaeon]|nr:SDR family NAD(P)-dependent oxidoreductase [Nitrososphaerota archaeon]